MKSQRIKVLAGGFACAALVFPAGAMARGGGGDAGGGGGGVPAACAPITPLNSGVIDKPASGKPITVDFKITNCTSSRRTVATTLVGTSTTVTSLDPYTTATCSTAPYSALRLDLKPGESRTI